MRRGLAALALAALGAAGTPALPLLDLGGSAVELAAPSGSEVLVVHFWAAWCPDCVKELSGLAGAARACAGSPVRVVAVDVGEGPEDVRAFLAAHPLDLPVLRDPKGEAWRRFVGGGGLPANLVWTSAGQRTSIGPREEASWREELARLGCRGASAM